MVGRPHQNRGRTLHIRKRALCIVKRALNVRKRALYSTTEPCVTAKSPMQPVAHAHRCVSGLPHKNRARTLKIRKRALNSCKTLYILKKSFIIRKRAPCSLLPTNFHVWWDSLIKIEVEPCISAEEL